MMILSEQRFFKMFVVAALFLLSSSFSAVAGDPQPVTTLDDIVVTATRMEEKSFDVPTPVEVVVSQALTVSNPASVVQPLESLPGVSVAGSGFWNVICSFDFQSFLWFPGA